MESARGFFLNYSKCIWDLNKVDNSHNCHGLKRVAQGRVSKGVEMVPFLKIADSPLGLCSAERTPWVARMFPTLLKTQKSKIRAYIKYIYYD